MTAHHGTSLDTAAPKSDAKAFAWTPPNYDAAFFEAIAIMDADLAGCDWRVCLGCQRSLPLEPEWFHGEGSVFCNPCLEKIPTYTPVPNPSPKSDAMLEHFAQFCARIRERLEMGKRVYGDSSFERPLLSLVEEIRQEVLDQAGWAFILYSRLDELEEKINEATQGNTLGI